MLEKRVLKNGLETILRLDKYVADTNKDLTRTYIQELIENGYILVNGKKVKVSYKVAKNDEIVINLPEKKELDVVPQEMNLDILYEDNDIIIVNKEKGIVVHPAHGNYEGTLVNGILAHSKDSLSGINGIARPGIVHRIDKDTSGILVIAKNDEAHKNLAQQFKVHSINRIYIALVKGRINEENGTIDKPIARSRKDRKKMAVDMNGKRAVTHFKVLKRYMNYTLVECKLETGRTHQIRVHMSSINHPLVGDEIYSKGKNEFGVVGQMLHAQVLGIEHPTIKKHMEFKSELPKYFQDVIKKLDMEEKHER